ncbi:MAG: hypothetical protein ABL953_13430 [Ilumatobacteraceae bacterium]
MQSSQRVGVRLGSFALVLAGTFGTAYAFGERLPGHDHSSGSESTHDGHSSGDSTSPMVPGSEMNGHHLVTEHMHGDDAPFHLRGPNGDTVTEFAMAHGALLHAIVIRPDLSEFQHVHPTIGSDGSWTVPITGPGQWHLVFESTPVVDGKPVAEPIIVTADIDDGTVIDAVPIPPADDRVEIDGLLITRNGFGFVVTNADGSAATDLEPYLEQVAHLVAIRQGDLAFRHLHPLDSPAGTFDFGEGVSEPGTYRLFLQFGHAGSVVTVAFTVVIS